MNYPEELEVEIRGRWRKLQTYEPGQEAVSNVLPFDKSVEQKLRIVGQLLKSMKTSNEIHHLPTCSIIATLVKFMARK